ncbi:MAG: hypothetical protein WD605_02885 [Candidatus Paceibacterota bacterium]
MKYPDITLGRVEAVWNKLGGEEGVQRFLSSAVEIVVKNILTPLRTIAVSAQPAATVSKRWLKEAGVVWTGGNFETNFFGLKVAATEAADLSVRRLEQSSLDAPILTDLGDKAEIGISQFRAFLAENCESKECFVFYLHGKNGELFAVHAYWYSDDGGWLVEVNSVARPLRWSAGGHVVSR